MGACAGGGRGLLNISWRMVEMAAGLLEPKEREVVLGDMQEGGEASWRGVPEVLGLYIRRQALLWRNWQPWLAAFGVALPTSFLLMGFSLSVSYEFLRFAGPQGEPGRAMDPSLPVFAGNLLLLVGWAWAGGFVVGSLSRRTLWASLISYGTPCLFCLSRFHHHSPSRYCLLVFVPPAAVGVLQGLRISRLRLSTALAAALLLTALALPPRREAGERWWSPRAWVLNSALTWPAWLLVATARRTGTPSAQDSLRESPGSII